eukprot:gene7722-12192_t
MFKSEPETSGDEQLLNKIPKDSTPEKENELELKVDEKTRSSSQKSLSSEDSGQEEVEEVVKQKKRPLTSSIFKPKLFGGGSDKEEKHKSGTLLDRIEKRKGITQEIIDSSGGINIQTNCHIFEIRGKKCEYIGDFVNNMPDGRGELKYSTGVLYEGEFVNGKRNGFGKLIFQEGGFAFGQWINDEPNLNWEWKIEYPNSDQYFGYISVEKKKYLEDIDLKSFHRNGDGEHHYQKDKIKYFGHFSSDKREGYGISIFMKQEIRYYGNWKDDGFHGTGLLIYKDGTVYQGTLFLPNGDTIEGNWKNDKIGDAVYTKGNTTKISKTILHLIQSEITEGFKHANNPFDYQQQQKKEITNTTKWNEYYSSNKSEWEKFQLKIQSDFDFQNLNDEVIKKSIEKILQIRDSFIQKFFNFFVSVFTGTYYAVEEKIIIKELQHATDDIKSFSEILSSIILQFFCSISKEYEDYSEYHERLIKKTVQTKVYVTLFPLYEGVYAERDILCGQKIDLLSGCSPAQLGVSKYFTPINDKEIPYEKTIKLLETIKYEKNITQKVEVLSRVRTEIMTDIRNYRLTRRKYEKGEKYTQELEQEDLIWQPGAEDIMPIYIYVFIHSSISNHNALYHYINDWKDPSLEFDPVIHMISFYEGFLSLVMDLDPNVKSESGLLIPPFVIDNSIKAAIQSVIRQNPQKSSFRFYWLSSLLVYIGRETAQKKISERKLILVDQNLCKSIKHNFEVVNSILSQAKELGMTIEIKSKKKVDVKSHKASVLIQKIETNKFDEFDDDSIVEIYFSRVYPSHIYSELSMFVSRYIRFEINN